MRPPARLPALLFRALGRMASGSGPSAALLVLTYHRVVPAPDALVAGEPDATEFAAQMDVVRELFNVLPLGEAIELRRSNRLPPRALAITFDDGYANNAEVAAPILVAKGLRATFFVATGFIGSMMWNDRVIESVRCAGERLDLSDLGLADYSLSGAQSRREAIASILDALKYRPQDERERASLVLAQRSGAAAAGGLMMSREQIRRLTQQSMEVGAHTVSHPILTRTSPQAAMQEIAASREQLQEITGAEIRSFAYPNGRPGSDYACEHVEMVRRAGFSCAVSTAWGCAGRHADVYQLPRIAPWDRTTGRYVARLLRAYLQRRPATV